MTWTLIESDRALEELLEQANKFDAVAIDTEFMRRNTFYPQVALLQLCFDGKAWLIDPLKIHEPEVLVDFMLNPGIVKILHSASEDLEVFQQWLGVLPQPMFDTQRAAALLGRGFGLGYRTLVEDICGVVLDKGETRSDWLQRPLTQSQCDYAALSVTHLLNVWFKLRDECETHSKLQWVFDDANDACNALASNAGDYYKKIKSAWKLQPRQLATLIAVCDWREYTARKKDKPRSWIIDDKACYALAEHGAASWDDLKAISEIPPSSLRRWSDALLELVQNLQLGSPEELPPPLPAPLTGEQRNRLKRLKSVGREVALGLSAAPEVLLPAKDYELLIREARGDAILVPAHWNGWRKESVIQPLRAYLAGEAQ